MVQIVWTDEALADMQDLYDYIEKRGSKFYAIQTLRKIRTHVKLLKNHIRIGKIVPEFNKEIIRELIEGRYRIIYRIRTNKIVEIISIWHSARDLSKFEMT